MALGASRSGRLAEVALRESEWSGRRGIGRVAVPLHAVPKVERLVLDIPFVHVVVRPAGNRQRNIHGARRSEPEVRNGAAALVRKRVLLNDEVVVVRITPGERAKIDPDVVLVDAMRAP